jgi:hypothetical protein
VTARGSEAGFVAGAEALALGVVVFVAGTLLVLNGWRLVDGKLAVETAAREATRAVVEAPAATLLDASAAASLADTTARSVMVAHRGPDDAPGATWRFVDSTLRGDAERCAPVTATATIDVDTVRLPLVGGFGTVTLVGEHTERIEPFRGGLPLGGSSC